MPQGNSAATRDARHILHGYCNLADQRKHGPSVISGGQGIYVFDENGNAFLEAAAGMWCTAFGFNDEELIEAAIEQLYKLPYYHTLAYKSVNPAIDLAEKLSKIVPIHNAKFHFALSGSEANDFLIKFTRYYNNSIGRPEKKKIISRINGFHGATLGAASLSGIPVMHKAFDLPIKDIIHITEPNWFHNAYIGENSNDFTNRLVKELENTIISEGPETIAGFIAEPISGAGGVIIPPSNYYPRIQKILDHHDIMFFADEVICGFGRTGKMWGCESMDIQPSTMTLAKSLTSGYQPLSALVINDIMYQGMEKGCDNIGFFGHGTTYGGHPVSCAVALKVLDIFESRNMLKHISKVSAHFEKRIAEFKKHPLVGNVRSKGLLGAIELVADKNKKRFFEPKGSVAKRLRDLAEERHRLIVRQVPCGDTCAFSPPLIITENEIDDMFGRFSLALDQITDEITKEGLINKI